MTARDEAIEAMRNRDVAHGQNPFPDRYYSDLLNAIHPNVLARLAIEQGGLVKTRGIFGSVLDTPFYRVVEP